REPYASQTTVTGEGGTITTSETINFVDVGIKLYVTPTINKDNFITMRIRPEVSSTTERYTTAKGEQIPIVSTSEAETSVMVKDGVTIIIGGLRKDENIKTVKKIPFIGEIPFLGAFFRNTRQESKKSDLVILLTPHIISGNESLVDFSEVKPRNGAIVQMKKEEIVTERITTALEPTEKNIQKSIFDYYCYINEKINQTAQKNLPNQEGKVKLSFVLSREGRLVEEPKVESSTEEALIAYAITAIKDASPFIPFPEGLEKEKEQFFIIIDYKK
ncbi:MAG: hypothetical protein N2Z79_05270, partial [Candidatus Omnitrophica bacterium]|nr:hypothetical protein [Candidatus Omnitrophota bacterium]